MCTLYVLIVTLYMLFTGEKLPLRINSKQRVASEYKACLITFRESTILTS